MFAGGLGFSLVEKYAGSQIPTVPVLGRAGTIAVAAYYLGRNQRSEMLLQLAGAAAVIAGYQVGRDGKVNGPADYVSGFDVTGDYVAND